MAEGEASHNRMKEGNKQEALEQLQINTEETQIIIQQAQQQAQQEARQYVGSVVNYAEQAHINTLREETSKTEQAKKRTKTTETSEHNPVHKNERTPDNRAKPKQRAGASPKKSPGKLLPPFPTGEPASGEPASGSQHKPTYGNPESEHEPKGKPGRPSNTQGPQPKAKAKAKASSVRQEAFTKTKHNQLHLHMVLRKTIIYHGVIGENQHQIIFC